MGMYVILVNRHVIYQQWQTLVLWSKCKWGDWRPGRQQPRQLAPRIINRDQNVEQSVWTPPDEARRRLIESRDSTFERAGPPAHQTRTVATLLEIRWTCCPVGPSGEESDMMQKATYTRAGNANPFSRSHCICTFWQTHRISSIAFLHFHRKFAFFAFFILHSCLNYIFWPFSGL